MISIVGAGASGLVMERICQINNWPHQLFSPSLPNPGNRSILLNPSSTDFLHSLGFSLPNLKPFKTIKITQQKSFFHLAIHAQDFQQEALCYKISMTDLLKTLSQYSQPISELVQDKQRTLEGYQLITDKGSYPSTQVIACDGSNSKMRALSAISLDTRRPYHIAIYRADVEANSLIQRYTSKHILAVIPGRPGTIIASSSSSTPPNDLEALLKHHASIKNLSPPYLHKITPSIAHSCFQDNTLLLANAALTIEPVAAQGLNHALMQLQMIKSLSEYNTKTISQLSSVLLKQNQNLYLAMDKLTRLSCLSRINRSTIFASSCLSSLASSEVWAFGSRYDT